MAELKLESAAVPQLKDAVDAPHDLLYADQVIAIAYGPFVSRVTLATENHLAQTRVPTVTLVMPTNMLHALARNIVSELDSDSARASIIKGHTEYTGRD